jgi:hypothetical protein
MRNKNQYMLEQQSRATLQAAQDAAGLSGGDSTAAATTTTTTTTAAAAATTDNDDKSKEDVAGVLSILAAHEGEEFSAASRKRFNKYAKFSEKLYNTGKSNSLVPFFDKACLKDGVSWEEGFLSSLNQSAVFVPIISHQCVDNMHTLTGDSPVDNVLLEWRMALELFHPSRQFLFGIFPVFISKDVHKLKIQSTAVVARIEKKVQESLENLGLGSPLRAPESAKQTFEELLRCQGAFASADDDESIKKTVARLKAMVSELNFADSRAGKKNNGNKTDSDETVEVMKKRLEEMTKQLREETNKRIVIEDELNQLKQRSGGGASSNNNNNSNNNTNDNSKDGDNSSGEKGKKKGVFSRFGSKSSIN